MTATSEQRAGPMASWVVTSAFTIVIGHHHSIISIVFGVMPLPRPAAVPPFEDRVSPGIAF